MSIEILDARPRCTNCLEPQLIMNGSVCNECGAANSNRFAAIRMCAVVRLASQIGMVENNSASLSLASIEKLMCLAYGMGAAAKAQEQKELDLILNKANNALSNGSRLIKEREQSKTEKVKAAKTKRPHRSETISRKGAKSAKRKRAGSTPKNSNSHRK